MNKMSIFSPDDIMATNFASRASSAEPIGNVVAPARDELLLLHYRHLDFERTLARHALARARQRPKDLANALGLPIFLDTRAAGAALDAAWRPAQSTFPARTCGRGTPTRATRWWDRYRLRV